jgi:hypothetical protein
MTAAETSSPRFTLLPQFGDGSPMRPRPPMPISTPFDAVGEASAMARSLPSGATTSTPFFAPSAFARYLTVLVSIKRP